MVCSEISEPARKRMSGSAPTSMPRHSARDSTAVTNRDWLSTLLALTGSFAPLKRATRAVAPTLRAIKADNMINLGWVTRPTAEMA